MYAILVFDVIVFAIYFVKGRLANQDKLYRFIALSAIFSSVVIVFLVFNHYEKELRTEELKWQNFRGSVKTTSKETDSLLTVRQGKEQVIDSLRSKIREMEKIVGQIKKNENITGKKSDIAQQVQEDIKITEKQINRVDNYNEILNSNDYWKYIAKGYSYTGNTTAFTFYPPYQTEGEYLDISIRFNNEKTVEKAAVIYLEVIRKEEDGKNLMIHYSFYRPQHGINRFKLQNYLRQKNTSITVGFFWKSELGKADMPTYEKYTYTR